MEIQSLSIVVPTRGCVCKCKTCVSRIHGHEEHYQNVIEEIVDANTWHFKEEYRRRLEFARDNGCNTMILTGAPGEPLQNIEFLKKLSQWNTSLRKPFYWMELQTTGVLLTDENLNQLRVMGVGTISLSNFNVFDEEDNFDVIGAAPVLRYDFKTLCDTIKKMGFNLRICLNLTRAYQSSDMTKMIEMIFDKLADLNADQVTFRKLYTSSIPSPINDFIFENGLPQTHFDMIQHYIQNNAKPLEILPFGARKYSYRGISTVLDDDCMAYQANQAIRYLILRENCKLYSRWDDKGSLVF